ncbi:MAG: PhoH family protein [Eubacteriales bacterium]
MAESQVRVETADELFNVLGSFDENSKLVEKEFGVTIVGRDECLKVTGESEGVFLAQKVLENLVKLAAKGEKLTSQSVRYCIAMVREGADEDVVKTLGESVCVTSRGKPIKAKTVGQKKYVDAIRNNTIVLGIGPAGTGKTYLAVAMAVSSFLKKEVSRIILTRPAVEAGENLGFLPGDLQSKVDPYLRPLYDALFDMFGGETYQKHLEKGNIEVAPLAYMRGRTLDDSFIILDEAQNTTPEQMKMFLTRLGNNSKAIITGDVTQIDLPAGKKSGLKEAMKVLRGIDDIEICQFTDRDVVRHELVMKIIRAYERYDEMNKERARQRDRR